MPDITLTGVFIAGLLSFLSPCVLPLVPPYLAYMAGTSVSAIAAPGRINGRVLVASLLFVLGFATVFVLLGAGASSLGGLLRRYSDTLAIVAGVAIIAMGLHFLGVFRLSFLYREARFQVDRPASLGGAYLMGLAFAFGWTPCIGPVLGSVMAVAGAQATVGREWGFSQSIPPASVFHSCWPRCSWGPSRGCSPGSGAACISSRRRWGRRSF